VPTVTARRIVAVSSDEAFGRQLAAALAAGADGVELHPTLDAIEEARSGRASAAGGTGEPAGEAGRAADAGGGTGEPAGEAGRAADAGGQGVALYVIHLTGAPRALWLRVPGTCPVIAVVPGADLAAIVELLQASDRVAAVMTADGFEPHQLRALAARIAGDDVFGLEPVLAPGTEVHSHAIGDYPDKARCLSRIAEFLDEVGAPRKVRAPIEQCIDEMIMNALYDAPVDARGHHVFAQIPTRTRITLRTEHHVAVRYACDGKQFAISVRDAFGTLARATVLGHLDKGLHAEQQVDRKAGGAGLGLYLMVHAATAVGFHVLPGIATEVVCRFDLGAPTLALAQLGFLVQRDRAGLVAAGPARRLPARSRWRPRLRAGVLGAIAVLGALGALFGLGVLPVGGGAPDRPPVATVELDSQPTGATVEIDGKPLGSTPLTLTSLAPGGVVSVAFHRTGYRTATTRLEVPAVGERKRLVQPLEVSDDFVRVHFVSSPPGAEIVERGRPATVDRTYTPADVFVEAGRVQRFTLTMPRHVPLVLEPFTPARGARGLEKGGDLVEGATLRIEATLAGTITVSGAPHCRDVAPPVDCTLAPGTYEVAYVGPDRGLGGAPVTHTVTMAGRDALEKLELGVIEAAPGKRLQPGGARRAVVEAGTYAVTVSDATGRHAATVRVQPGATVIVN
jgi:hypothetical protein